MPGELEVLMDIIAPYIKIISNPSDMDMCARKEIEKAIEECTINLRSIQKNINNALETRDNFAEAVNPLIRLRHMLQDVDVDVARKIFVMGDHIATMRTVYSHHGIYDGGGGVYEYQGNPTNLTGEIVHSSLRKFADGDKLFVVKQKSYYRPHVVVDRAIYRLHENKYNLLFNNCEHFATWCRLGEEVKINGRPKFSKS